MEPAAELQQFAGEAERLGAVGASCHPADLTDQRHLACDRVDQQGRPHDGLGLNVAGEDVTQTGDDGTAGRAAGQADEVLVRQFCFRQCGLAGWCVFRLDSGFGEGVSGGQAEGHAGRVGHVQAVGDAFDDFERGDLNGPFHDLADLSLAEVHRDADAGLAGSGVLADEPEELPDVPTSEAFQDFRALP
ncbi:hypothetical protein GCM10017600_78200 [Streptosporangium carneum]|uniref:Uncharacterized protein n=1 Tax=Streptosporangium carneum TaxID=47481 RepID=A0A9W6IB20_9ACTN|nr:hypothetical protein GCM10017600_78200 [Streptosporangium carneum]